MLMLMLNHPLAVFIARSSKVTEHYSSRPGGRWRVTPWLLLTAQAELGEFSWGRKDDGTMGNKWT